MKYEIRNTKYGIRLSVAVYLRAIPFLILLGIVPAANAAWYQVEVLVFEQLRPELNGEVWFENPGLPLRDDSIELITDVPKPDRVQDQAASAQDAEEPDSTELVPYLRLPQARLRLQNDMRILKLSADYRPLIHVAWQQPGYDDSSGRAVHIEQLVDPEGKDDSLPSELAEIQIIDESYTPPEPVFDGTIRLRTTRFLHVDVDIAYFPREFLQILRLQRQAHNNPDHLVVNEAADYVRLTESRKIKLNELHYFDHPLFGVLLQVSRLRED